MIDCASEIAWDRVVMGVIAIGPRFGFAHNLANAVGLRNG